MIDHLAINTSNELHQKTVDFYAQTLEPLGYKIAMELVDGKVVGFSDGPKGPDFWVAVIRHEPGAQISLPKFHFALGAKVPIADFEKFCQSLDTRPCLMVSADGFVTADHKTVDAVYAKGIEAGGKDNGAPGLRPQYHPTYYAAFLHDPVGNGFEVVCHQES